MILAPSGLLAARHAAEKACPHPARPRTVAGWARARGQGRARECRWKRTADRCKDTAKGDLDMSVLEYGAAEREARATTKVKGAIELQRDFVSRKPKVIGIARQRVHEFRD